ncbi:AMP-binding protein [Bordetella sp. H567]|uniref:AMP-binding protein n=1 Tax=Bordetella sp. H567 TaxID=1697043 RepID=UPI000A84E334|nr:AMP-binding protein [Bordetella sp. H567]
MSTLPEAPRSAAATAAPAEAKTATAAPAPAPGAAPAPTAAATLAVPDIGPAGSVPVRPYAPLRTLADILEIEKTPLDQRITRWDFALNLLDGCRHKPARAAIHATHNGNIDGALVTWSFADLERHSLRIANLLRASGIGAQDPVAIVSPTVPALFATFIGGLLAARPFPINWMLDAHALADLIGRSGAKAVIALGPTPGFSIWENVSAALALLADRAGHGAGEAAADTATTANATNDKDPAAMAALPRPPRLFTLHDPFASPHDHDLLTAAAAHAGDRLEFPRETATRATIACYVHSGGTTGHPKIVKVTHGGMVFRQWAANFCLAFTPDDVVLSDTPLFHIGGLLVRGLVSTADGHTTVIPSMHGARDKDYIANYWRYVERFGVTQISGVPTTLSVLAKQPPATEDISSLRPYFATGSTAMAPVVQERIEAITGARTLQTYGLTENTSHVTVDPRDGEIRRGYSGLRVPYTTVRIAQVDKDGEILRDCATGEIGMVLVRSPGVAAGYLDPAQNRGVFRPDGFLVTGDLGCVDGDGYLRISGRQKDLIIRGGHNIEPGIIENALVQAPGVALAAAVGKPDAYAGELPVAYVELQPGAQVTAEELLRFAAERIPERPAVPKEIILVDKLPLTAVGKPIKHLLQLDAAKRVFNEVLRPVACEWELEVVNTGGSGLKVSVALKDATSEARRQTEEILSAFSVPYSISETGAPATSPYRSGT